MLADVQLFPVEPTIAGLDAARGFTKLVKVVQDNHNPSLKPLVIVNMYRDTVINNSVVAGLQSLDLPLAKTKIGYRSLYQEAHLMGGTVQGLGARAKTAIQEIDALVDEVQQLLKVKNRKK